MYKKVVFEGGNAYIEETKELLGKEGTSWHCFPEIDVTKNDGTVVFVTYGFISDKGDFIKFCTLNHCRSGCDNTCTGNCRYNPASEKTSGYYINA